MVRVSVFVLLVFFVFFCFFWGGGVADRFTANKYSPLFFTFMLIGSAWYAERVRELLKHLFPDEIDKCPRFDW